MNSIDAASPPPNGAEAGIPPPEVTLEARWDLLLYWMSNVGEGSWDRFRNVVDELARDDGRDRSQLRRSLRIRLSEFGYADFFIGDSSRWETMTPLAAGLLGPDPTALLIGARTPSLLRNVQAAAARHNVRVAKEAWNDSPTVIRLTGPPDALNACAVAAGIGYAEAYAQRLAGALKPIPLLLERLRRESDCAPINWTARSYSLHTCEWVDGTLPNSACEFTPRYGRPRYFVSNRRRRLLEVSGRRHAVYAAASAQRIALAIYESGTRRLSVPLTAPLPEAYARVACLCSGQRATVEQRRIVYPGVPPEMGALLVTALGQPRAIAARPSSARE
jgi:hypothetical protein